MLYALAALSGLATSPAGAEDGLYVALAAAEQSAPHEVAAATSPGLGSTLWSAQEKESASVADVQVVLTPLAQQAEALRQQEGWYEIRAAPMVEPVGAPFEGVSLQLHPWLEGSAGVELAPVERAVSELRRVGSAWSSRELRTHVKASFHDNGLVEAVLLREERILMERGVQRERDEHLIVFDRSGRVEAIHLLTHAGMMRVEVALLPRWEAGDLVGMEAVQLAERPDLRKGTGRIRRASRTRFVPT